MNTDRIFISSTNTEEGIRGVRQLISVLSKIKRDFDFIENSFKRKTASAQDKAMILNKLTKAGATILVLSSDFLDINQSLLKKNNNVCGWNYEELSTSLLWNKDKVHNSIIIAYTDEFYDKYLKTSYNFSFPIINDNIDNLNRFKSSTIDNKDYMEVISLTEFSKKPKYYLNKVDRRKAKQITKNLYNLKFV